MGFLNKIKSKGGELLLKTNLASREPIPINIVDVKTAGIVYRADDEEILDLVKKFVGYLREYKIKVKAFGYFDLKKIPDDVNPKLEYDYFAKNDLNLLSQPKSMVVKNFVEEPFDLLIDVNVTDSLVFKTIVARSKAKFKVGKKELDYSEYFDLLIQTGGEDVKYLLRNVDHYLQHINKK